MDKIELRYIDEVAQKGDWAAHTGRQLIIGPNDTLIHASIDPEEVLDALKDD